MAKSVLIEWADLECRARMELLWDDAPALSRAIADCLPLRSISWHSVISGENVGFPLPIVWTAVDNPRPRTRGDVFLYANGQLGIIPYGRMTEPGDVNVFGRIHPDDIESAAKAGRIVAQSFRAGPGRPYFVDLTLQN